MSADPGSARPRTVAFVTWSGEPGLSADDQIAATACRKHGIYVDARPWDVPADWSLYDAIVLRTTWNYHLLPAAFASWLDDLERANVRVWNPPGALRWNMDKRYLVDLHRAGVRVPETVIVSRGTRVSLVDILREQSWSSAVIKPTISANAFQTTSVQRETALSAQESFDAATRERDMLVQRLLPEISDGEISLMFIGDRFSHAVKKLPVPGEFRVQEIFGGTAVGYNADEAMIETCGRLLAHIPGPTLYARVDGVMTVDGFALMEIEVIEPSLFF